MSDQVLLIAGLAIATFSIRFGGYIFGSRLPEVGFWASSFKALPGCLIASLLAVTLVSGDTYEYIAAIVALILALATRNLPLTMAGGIITIWALRHFDVQNLESINLARVSTLFLL